MKENKKYISNLTRMFRYLFTLEPMLFILVMFIAVIEAVLPYVNIIAIQLLIDGLIEQRIANEIATIITITITINTMFGHVLGELRKKREICEVRLDLNFQKQLNVHQMRLALIDIESTKVQELKRNIEQAKMRNGGVENIVSDFEMIVKNVITLVTTGVIFYYIYAKQQKNENVTFWTSPYPIIILIFLLLVCTVFTLKLQATQNTLVSQLNDKANKANGNAFAYMQFISNYHFGKEIRIFELGDYLCNFFENLWTSSIGYSLTQQLGREKAKIPCATVLCNEIINIFIYILAIGKAYTKEISTGNVFVYINSIQAFMQSMVRLIGGSGEIIAHGILIQPFLELLEMKEEVLTSDIFIDAPSTINEISFEHVYFKYPEQEFWVLEDVSFVLKANQKIALVGENGCGKSTLIKLICRLYEPNQGCIKLNGVNVLEYDKRQYWDMISVVFQDYSLPALSLGMVISGKDYYNKEKEKEILHNIGMDKWMTKLNITLEQYICSDFSNAGIEISGGESQKLAIARALYKGAPFVILDEPTASLDPISEAKIFNDFHQLCRGKTCIFISHRLYSCKICDLVIVLHQGKIVQQGTHEQLLKCYGKYKELWDSQFDLYREFFQEED